jgi:hypothetical protein
VPVKLADVSYTALAAAIRAQIASRAKNLAQCGTEDSGFKIRKVA